MGATISGNWQLDWLPEASVAVHVTTALGGVAVNPDAGLQFTPMGCPPSVAVGVRC